MSEDQLSGEKSDQSIPASKALVFPAINALFQPTAEFLGDEFRDWVKQKIQDKRRQRIEAHAERVYGRHLQIARGNSIRGNSWNCLKVGQREQET